ncbi:MAG: hypothetical protein H6814_08880 [Phycisphaeraceae bacterium]|nr:hypothetical protein [Phycisphaeraceae bacterium]
MTSGSQLNVFMAYQFRSSKLGKIDREYALAQAVSEVNKSLREEGSHDVVSWNALELESWHSVGAQVLSGIRESAVFIADISELNANVLLELGYAIGLCQGSNCVTVHVLAHESLDTRSIPSDLLGGYVITYSEQSFQAVVTRVLRDSAVRLAEGLTARAANSSWRELWGISSDHAVDVICSEIPDGTRPDFAHYEHPNFLRYAKFADLDSLFLVHEILASEFQHTRVRDYGATESIAQHDSGILVGGAAWNARVERIQRCLPFEFMDAENPETDSLQVRADGSTWLFESTFASSGIPETDYYVFAKFRPDGHSRLLLFGGGLTHGVLGGIKTLAHVSPGPTNALYLSKWFGAAADLVVVGCVAHRDGYLKAQDFRVSPPCLVLRRSEPDSEFHVVESACICKVQHQRPCE